LLDVEILLGRVGLEEGIKSQAEWVLEEEVASNPVGGEPELS
jgi:hypothetical protein